MGYFVIAPLAAHLQAENVEFMQFAFRWMNYLLMREISVENTIRMWDTYLVRLTATFQVQTRSNRVLRMPSRKAPMRSHSSTYTSAPHSS